MKNMTVGKLILCF